jgi:hypothetical protein
MDTLSEALPLTSVTVPSTFAPSRNVTVPVGTPVAAVTVALRLTACPVVEGFGVEVRVVVVAAAPGAFTAWVTTAEVLGRNVALPPYSAVSGRVPTASVETDIEALPLTSVAAPSTVEPSRNVTVPVGTPVAAVTVALRVTACPVVEGFGVEVRVVVVVFAGAGAGAGAFTTWVTTADVLAANVALPPYAAVSG